jgi:hypothetical protein
MGIRAYGSGLTENLVSRSRISQLLDNADSLIRTSLQEIPEYGNEIRSIGTLF